MSLSGFISVHEYKVRKGVLGPKSAHNGLPLNIRMGATEVKIRVTTRADKRTTR